MAGVKPDSAAAAAVQALWVRQARAQRDRAAGAAAVTAYYYSMLGRNDPALSAELGASLAGRVALAIERRLARRLTR
jgi:hypothetical protein